MDWRAFWQLDRFRRGKSSAIDSAIIGLGFELIAAMVPTAPYPESVKRALLARVEELKRGMQ